MNIIDKLKLPIKIENVFPSLKPNRFFAGLTCDVFFKSKKDGLKKIEKSFSHLICKSDIQDLINKRIKLNHTFIDLEELAHIVANDLYDHSDFQGNYVPIKKVPALDIVKEIDVILDCDNVRSRTFVETKSLLNQLRKDIEQLKKRLEE